MVAINNKVRSELGDLIRQELGMVDNRARVVAEQHWKEAEQKVANELGYGDSLVQIECLKAQIEGLQKELAHLEGSISEKAQPATIEDYNDCEIEVSANRYGQIYTKPVVFGHEIKTLWDIRVLKHLNEHLSFFQVYSDLNQLHHSVKRELLFAGTFEEARAVYYRFHEKILEALGEQMPKLLREVKSIPALKEY